MTSDKPQMKLQRMHTKCHSLHNKNYSLMKANELPCQNNHSKISERSLAEFSLCLHELIWSSTNAAVWSQWTITTVTQRDNWCDYGTVSRPHSGTWSIYWTVQKRTEDTTVCQKCSSSVTVCFAMCHVRMRLVLFLPTPYRRTCSKDDVWCITDRGTCLTRGSGRYRGKS